MVNRELKPIITHEDGIAIALIVFTGHERLPAFYQFGVVVDIFFIIFINRMSLLLNCTHFRKDD